MRPEEFCPVVKHLCGFQRNAVSRRICCTSEEIRYMAVSVACIDCIAFVNKDQFRGRCFLGFTLHCKRTCISQNWCLGRLQMLFVVKLVDGPLGRVNVRLQAIFLQNFGAGSSAIKTDRSVTCKCNFPCRFGIGCLLTIRRRRDICGVGFSVHHHLPLQSCQTA